MNNGRNIQRRKASRYISNAINRLWGGYCFSIYQISWIKIKTELFVNKRRHFVRVCLRFNWQCFGDHFSWFCCKFSGKILSLSWYLLARLLHLPLKSHLSKLSRNEAMKNVRSAHVFDLKLLKEFYLVFGIYCNINSFREISIGEGKHRKKQFDSFSLVFNSYALTLIKWHPLPKSENDFCWFILLGLVEGKK